MEEKILCPVCLKRGKLSHLLLIVETEGFLEEEIKGKAIAFFCPECRFIMKTEKKEIKINLKIS